MPLTKIFRKDAESSILSIDGVDPQQLCKYYFSVVWSVPAICNLYSLNGQLPPSGAWHKIITHMITDTDGEITVEIGEFYQGTRINLLFGIQAITDIERAAIVITNAMTGQSIKVLPKQPGEGKKIEKGQTWNAQIENYELH